MPHTRLGTRAKLKTKSLPVKKVTFLGLQGSPEASIPVPLQVQNQQRETETETEQSGRQRSKYMLYYRKRLDWRVQLQCLASWTW